MPKEPDFQLTSEPEPALAVQEPSVGALMNKMIDRGGFTIESAAVMKELVLLKEHMEAKQAERDFNAAFVKLQSELPVIVAETVIPNRGKYCRFEDAMDKIAAPLRNNGFSLSFSMDFKEGRVLEICTLRHIGGHSQSNSFAVRTGKADSDTQADCKAATTAKRNALLNCLNIVIRQDALQDEEGNAGLEGERVSFEQAETLREMVAEFKADEPAFLKYAGATDYGEIQASRYDRLFAALQKKARA